LRKRRKSREELFIQSIAKTYLDFTEFIENPGSRGGYLALISKLKPQARELIKSKLLDIKIDAEKKIKEAREDMRKAMEYYDTPDGT